MIAMLAVIVLAVVISAFELPPLLKNNYKKEVWVFFAFLIFSTGLSILWVLDVPLPTLFVMVEIVYKPFHDAVKFLLT